MNKVVEAHAERLGVDADKLLKFYRGLAPFPPAKRTYKNKTTKKVVDKEVAVTADEVSNDENEDTSG